MTQGITNEEDVTRTSLGEKERSRVGVILPQEKNVDPKNRALLKGEVERLSVEVLGKGNAGLSHKTNKR